MNLLRLPRAPRHSEAGARSGSWIAPGRMVAAWLALVVLIPSLAAASDFVGPPVPPHLRQRHLDIDPTGIDTDGLLNQARGTAALDLTKANPVAILADASQLIPGAAGASGGPNGSRSTGVSGAINIVVLLTVITLVPSIMLMTTCFIRIIVVLGLLKQALGTQTLPPPQVTVGLAMFMTLVVMSPTIDRIHKDAIVPYNAGEISDYGTMWERTKAPMRDFMFDQIEATGNWSSVYMMLNYRGIDTSEPEKLTTDDVDMISLIPAFMLSELKTSFLIGFKVYLPFLVIDMVIASILISMGMMMLPPVLISLPFKLLLFVMVDGWTLIVGSLLTSFVTRHGVGGPEVAGIVQMMIETAREVAVMLPAMLAPH